MGVGLATCPRLDRIRLAERGVSWPAKAAPVDPGEEVWAQTFCGWEPTPRAHRPLSVVQPLHIAHDLAPSPDAHRLPVRNLQAAHVLPDGANAAALAVLRGKNLRIHWGPQEERNSPKSVDTAGGTSLPWIFCPRQAF